MNDETFSAAELRELIWRSTLAAERSPEMRADVGELAERLDPTERAVIGRFLAHLERAAEAHARDLLLDPAAGENGAESGRSF